MLSRTILRLLILTTVVALQAAAHFILYRQRVTSTILFFQSDFLVFFLPAVIAFALYLLSLRARLGARTKMSVWPAVACSVGLTVLSQGIGMTVAFNTYGT
jgi:hypothetical protein